MATSPCLTPDEQQLFPLSISPSGMGELQTAALQNPVLHIESFVETHLLKLRLPKSKKQNKTKHLLSCREIEKIVGASCVRYKEPFRE